MWIMFLEDFLLNIEDIFATGVGFHKGFSRVYALLRCVICSNWCLRCPWNSVPAERSPRTLLCSFARWGSQACMFHLSSRTTLNGLNYHNSLSEL
jgi:hypothetical protein